MNMQFKKDFLMQVKKLYESSCETELKDFPNAVRRKYYITGNRQDFEKLYFRRRDYLSSCALLALSDNIYISELEKIILAVCDEYCWALPAHTDGTKKNDSKALDLFVAETSFTLAEICVVLGDKLSENIRNRIKSEIQKRLVNNYITQKFWWEECNMNWASVCGGFTGGTLIYLFPNEFNNQKERILKTLQCYIDGFSEDGICLEGASYWHYGFSAYVYFADLLYTFTEGKTDLLSEEKAKKIAGFMEKCFLTGNTAVSFSDGDMNFKADASLQHYLAKKLPENVSLLPEENMSICGGNTKWPCFYRTMLWIDDEKQGNSKLKNYNSENQIIINKENYSFALKGGNNNEPHNHNDLGSFIFADKNGQVLCDLGSGRYTKDYFNENRYMIFCNSSLSHNVPIINGKEQCTGKEYSATLVLNNNKAVADITNAYNENNLKAFIRNFEFNENSVIITDKINAEKQISVTERFVTMRKPEVKDNTVILDSSYMVFDKSKVSLEINEKHHIPHEYDKDPITVYCLDFTLESDITEVTFVLKA